MLEDKAEEVLESLWVSNNEQDSNRVHVGQFDPDIIRQLVDLQRIIISGEDITLTPLGQRDGRSVVRRHRLAERLLVDVLGAKENYLHEQACRFEHILDHGLDDRICILLGHPKICPHGKTIPQGPCCLSRERSADSIVSPLSGMEKEQRGSVAYIHTSEQQTLNKLIAMGVLPGAEIRLLQKFPSYVFESGNSQFAIDREIAESIYVRLHNDLL